MEDKFTNIETFFHEMMTHQYPRWNQDVSTLFYCYQQAMAQNKNPVLYCKTILYKLHFDAELQHYPQRQWQKYIRQCPFFTLYVTYWISQYIAFERCTPIELIQLAQKQAKLFVQYYLSSEWRLYDSIHHVLSE